MCSYYFKTLCTRHVNKGSFSMTVFCKDMYYQKHNTLFPSREVIHHFDVDAEGALSTLFFTFSCNIFIYHLFKRGKGVVFPAHALKACRGVRSTAPLIRNLNVRWRWVVNFTPWPLQTWKRTPCTHWIGGWMGPNTGLDILEEHILPLTGFEPQTIQPLA